MATPHRPAAEPVSLIEVDRSHRSVLEHLGQLFRYDLSEAYGTLPNPDGTYNHRELDLFLAAAEPKRRAWLIHAAGQVCGFAMIVPQEGGSAICGFFVVRAMRRTGVGREAARQLIGLVPGFWKIGFQSYNPGVQRFWSQVATDAVGDEWKTFDEEPPGWRPPDSWITFTTALP
jgi:predicted acetyltransferase